MHADDRRKAVDGLNRLIRQCEKCRLSLTRTHALCGEGDLYARLLLVAQAPGDTEDTKGRMFIGPSGKMLDELLGEAGVRRDEIYITNLIKCRLPGNRRPKQDEIDACARFLDREIALIAPEVIVPLGYYAARYVLKKYNAPMPEQKAEFHHVFGRLVRAGNQKIFPLPHPASLLYNKSFRPMMLKNYGKLRVLSHECEWFAVCPMKRFHEQGRLDKDWVELYCKGDWDACVRYHKEKRGEYHPDWMLPDGTLEETLK